MDAAIVILVVDDEQSVCDLISFMAKHDGYHVLVASDGPQALELSRRHVGHIDLLVSDIRMPGINGIELSEQVVKERPATKVLLISGSTDLEIPPAFRFLRKPFTRHQIRQAIADLLGDAADG